MKEIKIAALKIVDIIQLIVAAQNWSKQCECRSIAECRGHILRMGKFMIWL